MTAIPDFVQQTLEVQAQLARQVEITREYWADKVADKFYNEFVDKIDADIRAFIYGNASGMDVHRPPVVGLGLNDFLVAINNLAQEMETLCPSQSQGNEMHGISPNIDSRQQRVSWNSNHGPDPSRLNSSNVVDLLKSREKDWW